MDKFRFLKWPVYNDAKNLFSRILKIVEKLPKEIKFNLGAQLQRASFSIISNIAEGCGKDSDNELKRYFNIAIGSCYEVLAAIDTLKDCNFVKEQEFLSIYKQIESIADQLGGFKRHIKK